MSNLPVPINLRQLPLFDTSPFDAMRHFDDDGEYWLARELMLELGYTEWRNFSQAIKRAKTTCKRKGLAPDDHFVDLNKMVEIGSGSQRSVKDVKLSRYACYLVAMNGDPLKPEVANAQHYFVEQTRKQELGITSNPPPRQTKEYRRALDSGYSQDDAENWVLLDRKAKEARKDVTAEWAKRGGNIGKLTNFVTRLATGKRATDWKTEWQIGVSPRQYFSPLKKQAIAIVESLSAFQHRQHDSRGDGQLAADIADMADVINWEKLQRLEDRDLRLPDTRPHQKQLGDGR